MRRIIFWLFFLFLIGWIYHTSQAAWVPTGSVCTQSNSTEVLPGWTTPFNKNEGKNTLCLRQPFLVYVFAGKNIAENCVDDSVNTGTCTCGYTVDGQEYNSAHPLWQHRINAADARNVCGGQQFTQPNKNAQITEYKIFTKEYWYDTSYPLCTNVEYSYKDSTGTHKSITSHNGAWDNRELFAQGICNDKFSGCKQTQGTRLTLTHLTQTITPTLSDIVWHITSATCDLGFTVWYDPSKPQLVSLTDSLWQISSGTIDMSYYANTDIRYTIDIEDAMSPWSTQRWEGVSGIQEANIKIYRTHDYIGNPSTDTPTICEDAFTASTPKNKENTETDRVKLKLESCNGLSKAWKYMLSINASDYAGNTLTKDIPIHISPNQNLSITIEKKETYQSRLTENICSTRSTTSTCAEYETLCRKYEDRPSCNRTANVCTATREDQICENTAPACIRSEQYCAKRSWYGRCEEYATQCVEEWTICTQYRTQSTCTKEEEQCIEPSTISTCIESEQVCKRTTNTQDCIGWYADVETLTQTDIVYANNRDFYRYTLKIADSYGNPINATAIRTPIKITGQDIPIDQLNPNSSSAIRITENGIYQKTSLTGSIGYFELRSYVGGVFEEKFSIDISKWQSNGTPKTNEYHTIGFGDAKIYSFRKLFSTNINLLWPIILGQKQDVRFVTNRFLWSFARISNTSINYRDQLYSIPRDGFEFRNTVYTGWIVSSWDGYKSWSDTNTPDTTSLNTTPILKTRFTDNKIWLIGTPIIRYQLDDRYVRYLLDSTNDTSTGATCNIINSLSIEWVTQTTWREWLVSDKVSIGQIGWSTVQNTIRKNVALLIRNRTPDDSKIINWVLYRQGDVTLSGNSNWDTLIVIDGNITIDNNFNTEKKTKGIILLRDQNETKWNVFIKPNVEYIQATIFADGSIESVDTGGSIFTTSDNRRTDMLDSQLVLRWSLLTRNTIWWATDDGSGNYILPGKAVTRDFETAIRYDLSYLRMCNKRPNSYVPAEKKESVIILTDFEAIRNPPPGFTK